MQACSNAVQNSCVVCICACVHVRVRVCASNGLGKNEFSGAF